MSMEAASHPAWVCGLKLNINRKMLILMVTPCVGVWIETALPCLYTSVYIVTPCVGVWIETSRSRRTIVKS